jgi:ABC-type transport system involved in cytochrome c biogenesis permease subunit
MAVLIVAMMAATVLEKIHGTAFALRWVYHNPVFIALWGVAAVSGLWFLLERGAARKPFTLLLHVAFALILAGALITHLTGLNGAIHLREGEPTATFELDDESPATLPFSLELKDFRIEYDPGTRNISDYVSELTLRDPEPRDITISMNHILKYRGYRFYQADYDEDGQGSILAVSRDPWGVGVTYAGYLLLLVSMIAYFFQRETTYGAARRAIRRRRAPGQGRRVWRIVLIAAVCALLLLWWLDAFPKGPLMPVLRSPLLFLHMIPIMVSYALFGVQALLGIVGLLVRREVSERLRNVSLVMLCPAVFLLTFGTFLGAVWANISWGNYWAWDPKETWALVTLLVYSFPLHGKALKAFDNLRFFHAFLVVAFLCVLITYFGVNMLLGGMHSYA